jgi:hypothetical protein
MSDLDVLFERLRARKKDLAEVVAEVREEYRRQYLMPGQKKKTELSNLQSDLFDRPGELA